MLYSQNKSLLTQNLDKIPFPLNYSIAKILYQDWSYSDSQRFLKSWECSSDYEFKLNVDENGHLIMPLIGKNDDKYEVSICDIKNLNLNTEEIPIFEIRYKMIKIPGQNYSEFSPARTSLVINFYEKGKTDRDFAVNYEIGYSENWQTFRINLREEASGKNLDGLRVQLSNFWNRLYDGQTNLVVDYIKFASNLPWYKVVEIDREPLTNFPLYKAELTDDFFRQFKFNQQISLNQSNQYSYSDDFSGLNWITDSLDSRDIMRFGGNLVPKRHLSKASITYRFNSDKNIGSLNLTPKLHLKSYSQPSFLKVFIRSGSQPYKLAKQILWQERREESFSPEVDLSPYLGDKREFYLRFELYSDGISKYHDRAGVNAVLEEFKLTAKPY
jgi:hypothetical protein